MNLKDQTFQICKLVQKLPERQSIKNLLLSLMYAKIEEGENERKKSDYGYIAKNYKKQFLGYLYVDELIVSKGKSIPGVKLSSLNDEEMKLIKQGHIFIKKIIGGCLDVLNKIVPKISYVIDPYSDFKITDDFNNIEEINVGKEYIDTFNQCFQELKIIKNFEESVKQLPSMSQYSPEQLRQELNNFDKLIRDSFFQESANLSNDVLKLMDRGKDGKNFKKFLISLIYLKSILLNLSQLLFQSFYDDKIFSYNIENTIKVENSSTSYRGSCIELFSTELIGGDAGNIVFIDLSFENFQINNIYYIMRSSFNFGRETGSFSNIKALGINEDLSYYDYKLLQC